MNTKSFLSGAICAFLSMTLLLPVSVAQGPYSASGSIVSIIRNATDPPLSTLVARENDIQPNQRMMIEQILSLLPAGCEGNIRNFYVRYDNPTDRGLAGKDTVIVSGNVPDNEFRALLVHEILGHVTDLGCLQGTSKNGRSVFTDGKEPIWNNDPSTLFYGISWSSSTQRKSDARSQDFVSGYAYTADPFEDMAESTTFFLLHRDAFQKMTKTNPILAQKFQWIQTYVFPTTPSYARSTYVWHADSIPWDTTKLSYKWIAPAKVALAR